jgi:hypothetical protein
VNPLIAGHPAGTTVKLRTDLVPVRPSRHDGCTCQRRKT